MINGGTSKVDESSRYSALVQNAKEALLEATDDDIDRGGGRERNRLASAQVWATLAVAEAIREGLAALAR